MIGVFIQTNADSLKAQSNPIGYVIQESGCWDWVGGKDSGGYGQLYDPITGRTVGAHRWIYEQEHGPIPEGYQCHHICADRACVNPTHIELCASSREHFERDQPWQNAQRRAADRERAKTHCPRGHPYSGDNLYVGPNGYRVCRMCQRIADRKYRHTRLRREREVG